MNFKSFIKSRPATWILSAVLAVAMLVTAKILVEQHRVNKEIAKLEQQADKIHRDNEQLSYLIEYFNTQDYEEKQAREKLNMKKEGEYVVSLPEGGIAEAEDGQTSEDSKSKQWFNYFFNHEQ